MAGSPQGATQPQRWAALLRGVNLGSRNKISMADLRRLVSDLGAEDVATYVQSGNVVCTSGAPSDELGRALEREIRSRCGLDVTVLVRSAAELARLVAANPFVANQPDPIKLHVTFLARPADGARVEALRELHYEPDAFVVADDAVYLHCPQGYGRSKLSNAFFEKQLGVPATTRNWRTVTALAELAGN